jgi:hypothetical protein
MPVEAPDTWGSAACALVDISALAIMILYPFHSLSMHRAVSRIQRQLGSTWPWSKWVEYPTLKSAVTTDLGIKEKRAASHCAFSQLKVFGFSLLRPHFDCLVSACAL